MQRIVVVLGLLSAVATAAAAPQGACERSALPGLWTSADYSMRIAPDLAYEAAGAPNVMTIDVRGKLSVQGCTVRFTDTEGTYACPADQVGTYTFQVREGTLRFTLVKDECEGRRLAVTKAPLKRG